MFAALNSFLTRAVSGYFLNKSLRFRSSASAYLNRTPATASNRKTMTFSAWIKRGTLGAQFSTFWSAGSGSPNPRTEYDFSYDTLYLGLNPSGSTWYYIQTNAVYRDPAAWYHIVIAIDTTQATSTDIVKLYVNGTQVTSFASYSVPPQNTDLPYNNTVAHYLGQYAGTGQNFDGELAEVNFVDGQALAPTSFGASSTYNQWLPIRYAGTYGTNGFYLPFSGGTATSYAGSFNGSNQYLNVNSVTAVGTGDFTVETFVYFNALGDAALFQLDLFGVSTNWQLSLDSTANQFRFFVKNDAGTNNANIYSSAAAVTNQWYHVAGVVNGTTATLYVNGISVASATLSGVRTGTGTTIYMGQNGASGGRFLNGYMSNNRYVKGTAVYTANFIPPTANLTNITNTILLTLQNATIVDNSTNAFTITNTGTVVTSVQSPFLNTTVLTADSSGNANNWTPNNISLTAGSTYDSLTDVPTLTSTTVANYAVLNPLANNSGNPATVLNGNLALQVGNNASTYIRPATISVSSGKWYIEAVLNSDNLQQYSQFGIVPTSQVYTAGSFGALSPSFCFTVTPTYVNYATGSSATFTQWGTRSTGAVNVMICFDVTAGKIWFGVNNVWLGGGDPATGTSPTYSGVTATDWFFGLFIGNSFGGNTCTINFGQQPFTYTAPTGFLPLNTFNI